MILSGSGEREIFVVVSDFASSARGNKIFVRVRNFLPLRVPSLVRKTLGGVGLINQLAWRRMSAVDAFVFTQTLQYIFVKEE